MFVRHPITARVVAIRMAECLFLGSKLLLAIENVYSPEPEQPTHGRGSLIPAPLRPGIYDSTSSSLKPLFKFSDKRG
jgi:hypothetical protein